MSIITNTNIPVHGNYHGYYSKRSSSADPRLALLPPSIFEGKRVLDIGCNEGWVTCEIAQRCGATKVVGVDIDDALIRAAWKRRRTVWSLEAHPEESSDKKKRKRDAEDVRPSVSMRHDYFPASCEHMFGPLPVPPFQATESHNFPHNLSFRTADWVEQDIPEDAEGYDVILAFSITKWIHLNGGDSAVLRFFKRVFTSLKSGGSFILEPQPWDTYGKAKRMHPTLKETAKSLQLRPDNFEAELKKIGFTGARHLGLAGEGGFKRPVDLYVKP
ncbi:Bin3-domain-containing protein [Neolentinus lepideus HHB14362 ss-1]|uniref:RNA methyltransferase n=1 Tax=Neolentinus lepideus HHB14362 ss-1 TaxID=1314782 RepID=A0A165UFN5_9AGAM|nr:Bin3-domain-containing protein [Neolentinus lepideus HHB14362 ss-1]